MGRYTYIRGYASRVRPLWKCKYCGLLFYNRSSKEVINYCSSIATYTRLQNNKKLRCERKPLYREVLRILQNHVDKNEEELLDVGCGFGHFLKIAQDSDWHTTGFDIAPQCIGYAKQKGLNVSISEVKNFSCCSRRLVKNPKFDFLSKNSSHFRLILRPFQGECPQK